MGEIKKLYIREEGFVALSFHSVVSGGNGEKKSSMIVCQNVKMMRHFHQKKSFFTTIHHPNQFIEGSPESGQTADIII